MLMPLVRDKTGGGVGALLGQIRPTSPQYHSSCHVSEYTICDALNDRGKGHKNTNLQRKEVLVPLASKHVTCPACEIYRSKVSGKALKEPFLL